MIIWSPVRTKIYFGRMHNLDAGFGFGSADTLARLAVKRRKEEEELKGKKEEGQVLTHKKGRRRRRRRQLTLPGCQCIYPPPPPPLSFFRSLKRIRWEEIESYTFFLRPDQPTTMVSILPSIPDGFSPSLIFTSPHFPSPLSCPRKRPQIRGRVEKGKGKRRRDGSRKEFFLWENGKRK